MLRCLRAGASARRAKGGLLCRLPRVAVAFVRLAHDGHLEVLVREVVVVLAHELHETAVDAEERQLLERRVGEHRVAVVEHKAGGAEDALADRLGVERAQLAVGVKAGGGVLRAHASSAMGGRPRNALVLVGRSAAGVIRNHREGFLDLWLTAYDFRR